MREIVLDTETTGMDPAKGDRVIEIGALELVGHMPTGRTLQLYINPERDVPPESTAVHGITTDFLRDKPVFSEVYMEMMDFIQDSTLIIHNAEFDLKFLNAELRKVGHEPLGWGRVIDTVQMARKKFPGSPANLDALCRRFDIDNAARVYHGALLDTQLLAEVYLELIGGRQHGLAIDRKTDMEGTAPLAGPLERAYRAPRVFPVYETEERAHADMVLKLKRPRWN